MAKIWKKGKLVKLHYLPTFAHISFFNSNTCLKLVLWEYGRAYKYLVVFLLFLAYCMSMSNIKEPFQNMYTYLCILELGKKR